MLSLFSVVRSMWELVFNGSRGIGQSIYDLWVGNTYTNDPPPSGALQLDDSCACHYKSQLVEQWASLNVQKVEHNDKHNVKITLCTLQCNVGISR